LDEFRREYEDKYAAAADLDQCPGGGARNDDEEEDDEDDMEEDQSDTDELDDPCPKYLIFSTGSKTYTPHQIGFKRIGKINFPRRLDPGPSLKERIALSKRKRELEVIMRDLTSEELRLQSLLQNSNEPRVEPNWANYDAVADRFDKVDKLIDLHGHIIGMGLSPDHR
jgi:F-box and WD-40 domain protein 5